MYNICNTLPAFKLKTLDSSLCEDMSCSRKRRQMCDRTHHQQTRSAVAHNFLLSLMFVKRNQNYDRVEKIGNHM
jgi:hypothetical protein